MRRYEGGREGWVRVGGGERDNVKERIHKMHGGEVWCATDTRSDKCLRKRERE